VTSKTPVSAGNGKDIMMRIIDGDTRMPTEIANDQGYIGPLITEDELK
jgi:hypothetical protein